MSSLSCLIYRCAGLVTSASSGKTVTKLLHPITFLLSRLESTGCQKLIRHLHPRSRTVIPLRLLSLESVFLHSVSFFPPLPNLILSSITCHSAINSVFLVLCLFWIHWTEVTRTENPRRLEKIQIPTVWVGMRKDGRHSPQQPPPCYTDHLFHTKNQAAFRHACP